jgi:mannose-6-phosphate isomerase
MAKNDLRIDVLGTEVKIAADEEPEYLEMLLNKFRRAIENVQRITGLEDPLKTAVLTGFLLCDDLEKAGSVKAGQNLKEEPGEAEQLTLGMISRLEEIMPEKETPAFGITNCAVFRLRNIVKNYDWGSAEWLPALLGQKNSSRIPWAELWMGVNPAGPSSVVSGKTEEPLSQLIDREKEALLGKKISQKYGALPFLFKALAVEKPLSLQVHPDLERAQNGFEFENQTGIPKDAPNRNYHDPNRKTEVICALTTFVSLAGFRKVKETIKLIAILSNASLGNGGETLKGGLVKLNLALKEENPERAFLVALYDLESETIWAIGLYIKSALAALKKDFPEHKDEWELCAYLSGIYPKDPAVFAPLFLNIIELESGEAMYLPPGIPHAYIRGMGMELMNNSDNVIRGGLTGKHVDRKELFAVLDFSEFKPEIMRMPDPRPSWFTYPAPSGEFSLSVMHSTEGAIPYPLTGPSILLVTQGSAVVTGTESEMILKTGESVFISAGEKPNLAFNGNYTAYIASV